MLSKKREEQRAELGRELFSPSNPTHLTSIINYIIAHAENDNRPFLKVSIYGHSFLGLLDSGCTTTVIGSLGWNVLKTICKLGNAKERTCTVANGNQCPILGSIRIPIQLQGKVKVFDVLVVPSLPHSLILGIDFWCRMGVVPNLHSGEWCFLSDEETYEVKVGALQSAEHLTIDQRRELDTVVEETFKSMGDRLGCTTLVEHVIQTNSPPIKQRHYPLSPALQKQVNVELDQMLKDDIIEPSKSAWASPIVLIKKPDGRYRFCVNYKRLNEVSLPDAYPLPFITSTLDKLRDARYLTTLDIKSAYWQIPVAESSRPLTAFVVPRRGLFQFKRMPFGLHNAPATWQRFIDRVINVDLEEEVFIYLDDIVISTSTFERHMEVLKKVIQRLQQAGLTLNKEKCCFCKPELKYLGYVVNEKGLLVDPEKVEAIINIPPPRSVKEVRRVVGLASWYRRFVPNFSTLTSPLTNLLKKNVRFNWDENCQRALDDIKNHLISAPVLTCPNFDLPFVIQTDASDYGLGAVLSQQHEDGEKVIAYLSRSLTKSERKFTTTEKECLAVLFAIEKLRPYIEGSKFTVVTDHYSLKWLFSIRDPVGRICRWAVRLQQYDFEIVHRKGKDNVVPDTLSRSVPVIDSIDLGNLKIDKWYNRMLNSVKQSPLKYPLWRVYDEVLYKRANLRYPDLNDNRSEWLEVVPKGLRPKIIHDHHDPPTCGHLGIYKTINRISDKYYWPSMKADVARYIARCTVCLETKPLQKKAAGLLLSRTPTLTKPWQLLSIDVVGPLPRSSSGHSYILSVSDCFSKFCLLFPMRNMLATTIVKRLEEDVFLVFGVPLTILTDNGVQFKSHIFRKLTIEYQIKHLFVANYHPQANPVERTHRVLKTMLSSYVKDNHKTWSKFLPKVAWALRSAKHEVTEATPNLLIFGRELSITGNTGSQFSREVEGNPANQSKELERVYRDVCIRLKKAYDRSSRHYNLRHRDERFSVGQDVWKRNFVISDATKQITSKLSPKFTGPFTVHRVVSPWTYELIDKNGKLIGIWHAKDLKAHPPDDVEDETV